MADRIDNKSVKFDQLQQFLYFFIISKIRANMYSE
ncbi:hypothetical protein EATG_03370 [Escherichia coli H605]|uniref:Uncharacterized protein n=1 Tax=Escherichia coli H605 TaxID=656410 RepID=A0AAJ3U1W9_ECOLX|nr:hypothetical protein EATG_03370 [Escherichia coli H605]